MNLVKAIALRMTVLIGTGLAAAAGFSYNIKCESSTPQAEKQPGKAEEKHSGKADEAILQSLAKSGLKKEKFIVDIAELHPPEKGKKLLQDLGWNLIQKDENSTGYGLG